MGNQELLLSILYIPVSIMNLVFVFIKFSTLYGLYTD